MKGLKVLALTAAMAAASSSAFALEAMDEETLSATTGQAGIDIALSLGTAGSPGVAVDHVRWEDVDGFGATYTKAAILDLANVEIYGDLFVQIDAGTNEGALVGDASDDQSSLLISIQATGLGLNVGQLTLGSNDDPSAAGQLTQATLDNSRAFGNLSISNLSMPSAIQLQITPGGAGGDGITIGISGGSVGMDIDFEDTGVYGGGHIAHGVQVNNISNTTVTIDALDSTASAAANANLTNGALAIGVSAMSIDSVVLSDIQVGDLGAGSLGNIALVGVNLSGTTIYVGGR